MMPEKRKGRATEDPALSSPPSDTAQPTVRVVEQRRCERCGRWFRVTTGESKHRTMGAQCARRAVAG